MLTNSDTNKFVGKMQKKYNLLQHTEQIFEVLIKHIENVRQN